MPPTPAPTMAGRNVISEVVHERFDATVATDFGTVRGLPVRAGRGGVVRVGVGVGQGDPAHARPQAQGQPRAGHHKGEFY